MKTVSILFSILLTVSTYSWGKNGDFDVLDASLIEVKDFPIDTLMIRQEVYKSAICDNGGRLYKFLLRGSISPDSSFAIESLFDRAHFCDNSTEGIIGPIIELNSGGGYLDDGFKLGATLRQYKAISVVKNDAICASSCAVAFLGGVSRLVEESGVLLYHAPYSSLSEINGEKRANCDAGPDKLNELKNYYIKMTNERDGKRVFDRTMWYCSSENGWTLTGGNSAELFGLATHASDLNTFFGSTYTWLVQAINLKECDFPEEKTSLVQRAINGELEAYVFDFLSETTCRSTPCHSSCEILNYR